MTNQTKILLVFVAIAAFAIGIAMNSAHLEHQTEASELLQAKLETTDGVGTVQAELGELTLVNFWATWCTPCRDEMPLFEAMYRLHQPEGFKVVGVAIDNPSRSQPFLDSMDISYPILYAEKTGMQLLELTGNPQGLLPYSLLLDKDGNVIDQVLGKINEAQIREWLKLHLS